MFRQGTKWLLVAMLALLLGFHWAMLQTAAWVGMMIKYSEGCTLSQAVEKTFDGKHPCKLCNFVREGKKAESKSQGSLEIKKLDAFTVGTLATFSFPLRPLLVIPHEEQCDLHSAPPLLRPPRALLLVS